MSEADFSQERVVWKARKKPGLLVHGPPGTGKSQTIVNVIADALAHDRTILMVCQKQAATRVVMERLRSAGLADLCVEVNQPEADRQAIFREIRGQVATLSQANQPASPSSRASSRARSPPWRANWTGTPEPCMRSIPGSASPTAR